MTNDILDSRRKNLVKKNIEGRESIDESEVFTFTPYNRNFSIYSKEPEKEEKVSEKALTGVIDLNIDSTP